MLIMGNVGILYEFEIMSFWNYRGQIAIQASVTFAQVKSKLLLPFMSLLGLICKRGITGRFLLD